MPVPRGVSSEHAIHTVSLGMRLCSFINARSSSSFTFLNSLSSPYGKKVYPH